MNDPRHRELVERYFFEVHQNMQLDPMDALFDPDLTPNTPDGGALGLQALKDALQRQVWPLLVPGSVNVEVAFLPLERDDRARPPEDPSALIKFRARLEATRRQPHPEFGTAFTHEITNVWRIRAGRCLETWPSFSEETADRDVMERVTPPAGDP